MAHYGFHFVGHARSLPTFSTLAGGGKPIDCSYSPFSFNGLLYKLGYVKAFFWSNFTTIYNRPGYPLLALVFF